MNKLLVALAILLIAFALISSAGWNDIAYSSPQDGIQFRQGGNITITLKLNNSGIRDGSAAYVTTLTLLPNPCISRGESITQQGATACPNTAADTGCVFRFKNATVNDTYTFENLTTDANCPDGEYQFSFHLEGNTEVGMGGSFADDVRTADPRFTINFIGPHFCGDGTCDDWHGENCTTCPRDCGACTVCVPGRRTCIGDSIAECSASGFWNQTGCPGGCRLNATDEPECMPPCSNGARECIGESTLSVCDNHKWRSVACPFGCLYDDCKGNCATSGCPETCADFSHLSNGTCNSITGKCSYSEEHCSQGCDSAGVGCLGGGTQPTPAPTPGEGGGLGILPIAAGAVIVLALGAVAYFKFLKKPSEPPRGMPPQGPPPGATPPEQKPPAGPSPFSSVHTED